MVPGRERLKQQRSLVACRRGGESPSLPLPLPLSVSLFSAMKSAFLVCFFSLLFLGRLSTGSDTKLEDISDENLHKSIETEPFVIVLFLDSKKCEDDCAVAEQSLVRIREDLVDALSAWVTKTWDSPHLAEYGIDSVPAVVYFRKGHPMVYDGNLANEDELYEFFTAYREETYVKKLDDDNFEHLTQAASGATTGDWLVMFHTNQCSTCLGVQAKLETVGARVSNRMNVAAVNRDANGAKLGRRFQAYADPTLILFHLGTMYRYTLPEEDVKSLLKFAQRGFDLVPGEPVPQPKSAIDDTMEAISHFCIENWILLTVAFASVVLFICALSYSAISASSSKSKKKKSSKKKK